MRSYISVRGYVETNFAYKGLVCSDIEEFTGEVRSYYDTELDGESVEVKVTAESECGHYTTVRVEHRKAGGEDWDFIDQDEIYIR